MKGQGYLIWANPEPFFRCMSDDVIQDVRVSMNKVNV